MVSEELKLALTKLYFSGEGEVANSEQSFYNETLCIGTLS